jgi:hypothetical protein
MADTELMAALTKLTAEEQKALLAIAEYMKSHRSEGSDARSLAAELLAELLNGEPRFRGPDEGLSAARIAARRFMRENPALMHLLAQ